MKCPSCSADSSVLETRKAPVGTRRRRSCACGTLFTTMEIIVPDRACFRGEMRLIPTFELARIRKMIDRLALADHPGVVQANLHSEQIEREPVIDSDEARAHDVSGT